MYLQKYGREVILNFILLVDGDIVEPSVFMVSRDSDSYAPQDPVDFDQELDRDDDFSSGSSVFTAKTSGLYFFSISAGFFAATNATYYINSPLLYIERVDVHRTSTQHNDVDTTSRDVIFTLNAGDTLQVSLEEGGVFSEPAGAQTSFAGFSLHDTMRPVLAPAFSVSRIDGQSTPGVISYNFDITNRNLAVNLQTGVFTPQKDGIYFLSFSVGVLSSANNVGVIVRLTVDGEPKAELTRQHASYDGIDTLSRCVQDNVEYSHEVRLELARFLLDIFLGVISGCLGLI